MYKLFIIAHKDAPADFCKDVNFNADEVYLVSNRDIKNESRFPIIYTDKKYDDRIWSEISCFETICKNTNDDDFIIINHYRRITPEIPRDGIPAAAYLDFNTSMFELYNNSHNGLDILNLIKITDMFYPEISNNLKLELIGNFMFAYNIVLLSRNDFINYTKLLKQILGTFLTYLDINNYEDILTFIKSHESLYLKGEGQNRTIEYQARLISFLSERLATAYLMSFNKINFLQIKLLEEGQII